MRKMGNYVNDLGYNKICYVDYNKRNENNKIWFEIWAGQNSSMETTGVYCGGKFVTEEYINYFCKHYNFILKEIKCV